MAIGVAVIGCGKLGRLHAAAYQAAGASLAYVADSQAPAARSLAEELGCPWTADPREALASRSVVAVSVCVPTDQHCPVTLDALQAGKHVLCEKPLGCTVEEAGRMLQAARTAGVVAQTGFMKRFDPALQAAHAALAEIGPLESGRFRAYLPFTEDIWAQAKHRWILEKARSGGGALAHSGSHVLDAVRWFCGPVRTVDAHLRYREDLPDIEYLAQALLRTASGIAVTLEIAWLGLTAIGHRRDGWDEVFTVTGARGVIAIRTGWWNRPEVETVVEVYTEADRTTRTRTFGRPDPFARQIARFLHAIETGGSGEATFEDGYEVQRLLDAIYRSAASGIRVDLGR